MGEQDFHHLKRDQAILVEFPVFPSKFIELIDLCLHSTSISSSNHGSGSSNISGNLSSPSSRFSIKFLRFHSSDMGRCVFTGVDASRRGCSIWVVAYYGVDASQEIIRFIPKKSRREKRRATAGFEPRTLAVVG